MVNTKRSEATIALSQWNKGLVACAEKDGLPSTSPVVPGVDRVAFWSEGPISGHGRFLGWVRVAELSRIRFTKVKHGFSFVMITDAMLHKTKLLLNVCVCPLLQSPRTGTVCS